MADAISIGAVLRKTTLSIVPTTWQNFTIDLLSEALACRGVGASLSPDQIALFDQDHAELLERTVDQQFTVLHSIDCRILRSIS